MTRYKPFVFVLTGMLAGTLAGLLIFYNLDQTRGWNPYGWWLPATFLAALAGGLAGFFLFGMRIRGK